MTIENANNTHARYGAVKGNSPRKDILTPSFLLPHTYTIMNASELPRKCTEIHGASKTMHDAPNASITMKSPVRPLNSPSSRSRQYRHKKYM